ncbi:hypothetical protein [Streptomyces sp. NPDC001546]|uniref:hypothetical protein n=1 Tax=Streptomyces sp. NPDC001546 TaxID=3364585 RepID=UPI00369FF4E6
MPDDIRSADELGRALAVYGAMVARVMHEARGARRFRLVAHRLNTGGVVGIYEWVISPETGRLRPAEDPWVVWADGEGRAVA